MDPLRFLTLDLFCDPEHADQALHLVTTLIRANWDVPNVECTEALVQCSIEIAIQHKHELLDAPIGNSQHSALVDVLSNETRKSLAALSDLAMFASLDKSDPYFIDDINADGLHRTILALQYMTEVAKQRQISSARMTEILDAHAFVAVARLSLSHPELAGIRPLPRPRSGLLSALRPFEQVLDFGGLSAELLRIAPPSPARQADEQSGHLGYLVRGVLGLYCTIQQRRAYQGVGRELSLRLSSIASGSPASQFRNIPLHEIAPDNWWQDSSYSAPMASGQQKLFADTGYTVVRPS